MASKGRVLVTGASGYIAGFAIQQLLRDGWSVRGTVRNPAKSAGLHKTLGINVDQLELVAADLSHDAGWADAAKGVDYVLHIASPIPAANPKHDDEIVVPAREGTLRVLRAARDAGVKRVVMTSSTAAICYGMDGARQVFTEADWTNPAHPDTYAYVRSKVIAERAARDFMAREGGALEFATINPGAVLGPVLGNDYSASLEIISKLMNGELPGLPNFGFAIVDVRDIADAHVRAMTAPGMNGERFLCAGEFLWMKDIAAILKDRLGQQAKRVPTRGLPDFLLRLVGKFDKTVGMVLPELGKARICDASHAKAILGWVPRPAADSIVDCANSMIAHGLIIS
ncbi:aldehyde reductase [Polymorphobacter arshaanensis]|uniref:Aldehyde reductase n=1 Tax=Glacieibacterium arshaanense TaxID=2511025 RepID=A0A4Y9EKB3_9SPHN|nr:aldehyde reductase [Polymorphobacter arshaanensis]TFU01232.1 aldehyde reductase [Polymorphobacter arshaanensis]